MELKQYIEKPDATYRWRRLGAQHREGVTVTELELTSQTWQGIVWKHRMQVFTPDSVAYADAAFLTIGADYTYAVHHLNAGVGYAAATGMVCAYLYDIPNQPLFDDLVEDALIAYTLVQRLDTGDPEWPLLYPMVKGAMRAMDALQEFCAQESVAAPERFLVGGASKRGWTTWLTAAVDARVAGILPMVYDNLNLLAQMPHQVEVCDTYSEQISDYTKSGLIDRMRTLEGVQLAFAIDPYTYRD